MSAMELLVETDDEGRSVLKCPAVGVWKQGPALGQIVAHELSFGCLVVLGRRHELVVPAGVRGVIVERSTVNSLGYGDVLATLSNELEVGAHTPEDAPSSISESGALVFKSPSSGRFYLRPAPDKEPFISVGEEISEGQIVFLLEVMKTFSRIAYGGDSLPKRARVLRILPADGDDLEPGQVVVEVEAL